METKQLLNSIIDRKDLTQEEAHFLLSQVAEGNLKPAETAALLIALRTKGETVDEIIGLIEGMRQYMVPVVTKGLVIDTCGTGGDDTNTFNISTAVALVVAGSGVKVAKHGNRAASSKCGSADVLEALGVNIMLTPEQAASVLEKVGMVFLFAPLYHPAMKHIAPVRKELGVRTVFNFLGPFLSPVKVKHQIVGVPNVVIGKKLAQAASKLNYTFLCIVCGKDGMDEVSTLSETQLFFVKKNNVTAKILNPKKFGMKKPQKKELLGGDAARNAKIIREILDGKKGAKRDIVLLNSAVALFVAGKAKTIQQGIILAEKSIDSGSAKQTLQSLIKETNRYA